ncbi:MAG: ROK family protein [Xanthobacteraceae bacterium]|jgi:predicted NBD/HSP70 family sugar kinase
MSEQTIASPALAAHGSSHLPSVEVDCYNIEIKDEDGFVGDRASKGAFREILEKWRKPLRKTGEDPFGDETSDEISKKKLDSLLAEGHPDAAGVLQGAMEDFAQELARVIRRFLKLKAWRDTERIVVGGGLRESRVGELAIARAGVILKAEDIDVDLEPIRHDPDEAGLIGAGHLAPSWLFKGHDAILAVDIGGTNIRAGVVHLNLKKSPDLVKAAVGKLELWRHADEDKVTREEAVERLCKMLRKLIARAEKDRVQLAPFIGIGCPGIIDEDGTIERGAQNLPGNWESRNFHLPTLVVEEIPTIGDHETSVLMHNDAVVQGLSEVPFMQDVEHWGVLTIGTGLGNARFTNRAARKKKG